jgi:hypothetical protein
MASLLDYLGYAGNMLDLPGSSLRDILSGRDPFDQWATPFSGENRASGRDVLNPIFGANKETGMSGWLDDPWEGVKDLAGFGLEVVADPLNLIPAGALSKVLKGRKAARGVNTAIDAVAASPARARLAAELAKGFGEEAAAPTMKALDAFVLKNKMKPDDVYGKMSVGDAIQNPVSLGEDSLLQLVYHGTPHTFEPEPGFPKGRPRLDKIGTGEGAQIRGRGIYFAESDKLGDLYRRNVASKQLHEKMFDLYDEGDAPFAINQVMENLDHFTPSEQKLLKSLDEHDWLGFDYPHQAIREALSSKVGDRYDDIEGLLDVAKEHGSTYKLDLPDNDIEKMLDQDALLVNQPTHVLDALKKAGAHPELEAYIKEDRRLGLQGQDLLARKYRMTDNGEYGPRFQDLMEQIGKNDIAHRALKNNRSPALKAAEVLKNIADLEPGDLALHNQSRHMRGKELTEVLERAMGADDTARFFTSIGIPGAKFKDAVSRNANPLQQLTGGKEIPSTSNYTVWDQDVLDRTALLERNGNTLYQGENPITNTPEFKNWFGDWEADPANASKVVDGTGKPLRVFHGTGAAFDEFSASKAGSRDSGYFGKGFYFSDKPVSAEMYAGTGDWFTPAHKPNIKPVYLSLKNPLITSPAGLQRYGWKVGDELTSAIKADGHDGAIITHESGLKEYLAFDPTQIKSTFNRGTFDPANPNLLAQKNRGMVTFGEDGSSLINPISPDFSTAPHEVSHVMRRMLGGEQAGKAADIFGGSSSGWSREAEESFAQGAEAYFQNASTSSPGMQQSLQQMNRGFAGVYDNPIQTRDGGTEFFRDILGITENSSPLDRQRIPGIVGPVAAGAAYNAIARYNPRGGVQ